MKTNAVIRLPHEAANIFTCRLPCPRATAGEYAAFINPDGSAAIVVTGVGTTFGVSSRDYVIVSKETT